METSRTEAISLAKALSVKNRLAGRLAQSRSNVENYNSVLAGQRENVGRAAVDVRGEFERLQQLQEALVVVKAAVHRANAPIYEDVLRLGERKALIQMLNGLNTKHGVEPGFNGIEFQYDATITKPDVLERVRELEAEIDTIQDKLNQYNAATKVDIPQAVLDLAR